MAEQLPIDKKEIRFLDWGNPSISRKGFWLISLSIGLCIVGFGVNSILKISGTIITFISLFMWFDVVTYRK